MWDGCVYRESMPVTRDQAEKFRYAVAEGKVDDVRKMLVAGFDVNHKYEVSTPGLLSHLTQ